MVIDPFYVHKQDISIPQNKHEPPRQFGMTHGVGRFLPKNYQVCGFGTTLLMGFTVLKKA